MSEPQLYLISLVLLFLLDLLTVAARTSFLNAGRVHLIALGERDGRSVDRTLELISQRSRTRTSFHFLLVVLRALLVGLVLLLFNGQNNLSAGLALGTLLVAGLGLWVTEFIVQWIVLQDPETWAVRLTALAGALTFILTPILAIPNALFTPPADPTETTGVVTEDELKTLVDASEREGVLEQDERAMIFSIFRFGDTYAREIMIPRIDVLALNLHTPLHEAVDALLESGFSRVPVFDGTIDNIIGLLYVKDLLRVWRAGQQDHKLKDVLRPAYFVPEVKKADELLEEMQAQRIHMAIVVDEYGGMAGLVTLEDIVEEIIGEVQDEYDQGEELLYQQVAETEYLFHGRIDLDDFNEFMNSEFPGNEADTLGGYIYSQIGRVPKSGESIQTDDILLTIEQVTGRRIHQVRAQRVTAESPAAEEKVEPHADG